MIVCVYPLAASSGASAADDSGTGPSILLVDDGASLSYTYGASYFIEALDACGFGYDVFDVAQSATVPTISHLCSFDVVVWTTGNQFGRLQGEAARRVIAYLNSGGAMFISSEWLAYSNYGSELMRDYLHIAYDYWSSPPLIRGMPNDPITSDMVVALEHPPGFHWDVCNVAPLDNYPKKIFGSTAGSQPSFMGLRVPSDEVSLDYRVVLTCFPFEAIVDE